jgi:cation diffusion facilitator family transporter
VRSPALAADGRHILSDVVTSSGVLIGLLLAQVTGWLILDPLLAVAVAVNILWAGWRVIRESLYGLMDTAVSADVLLLIRETIKAHAGGALQIHDLRTRAAGRATFIEFHLVVPGGMTVAAAHEICDRVETALLAAVPGSEVLIHVEPEGEAKGRGALAI